MSSALAAVTMFAALVNWWSRRPGADDGPWIQWLTKPAVTVGLIALAAVVQPANSTQQRWFLIGLALCLVGDVALMWRPELFRTGLVSFLLGHLAFVAGFVIRARWAPGWSIALGLVVLISCIAVAARHLFPAVRATNPQLFGPVLAYVVVIGSMVLAAGRGGSWLSPVGAATFALSDLTLADNKFVSPRPWSPVLVMVTYHLALVMLVLSLR